MCPNPCIVAGVTVIGRRRIRSWAEPYDPSAASNALVNEQWRRLKGSPQMDDRSPYDGMTERNHAGDGSRSRTGASRCELRGVWRERG